jgi:multiple sugar transport system ATP-binding protein
MAQVRLENVSKYFGDIQVLKDLSFSAADGGLVVLVGPSGCGKSTILRLIAGLDRVSKGEIYIGNRLVNYIPPKDRNVAMVFQSYALYPHLSVYENLAFGLKMRRVKRSEIDKKVKEVARLLAIEDLASRKPRELSGGERQRVAMGRAMVRDPDVFLFDEPLSNLDAQLRVQMRKEIKTLHRRLRKTLIYVTHDQIEAMTLADHIVVLHKGKIQQIGSPSELYHRPANLFVAGFIGSPSMNLLEVVAEDGPKLKLKGTNLALPLIEKWKRAVGPRMGRSMILGIRPEDMGIVEEEGMSANVEIMEPVGAENYFHVSLGGVPLVVRGGAETSAEVGSEIRLSLNQERLHLFDYQTGKRLE